MKLRLLTCAIVASLTGLTGVAMSATADSPYQEAVELTDNPATSSEYKLGVIHLQEQINQGDGRAAMKLASLLLTKERQNQDTYPYAIDLYRKAVSLGAGAELELATTLMRQGLGLGRDTTIGKEHLAEAKELFRKLAASPTAAEANWYAGFMETRGMPEAGDFQTGYSYIRRAADAGHPTAAYWMAAYLEQEGKGRSAERIAYLRTAAAKDHSLAQQDLAKIDPSSVKKTSVSALATGMVKAISSSASSFVKSIDFTNAVQVASLDQTPPPSTSTPAVGAIYTAPASSVATVSVSATPSIPVLDQLRQERDALRASLTQTQGELDAVRNQLAKATQDKLVLPSSLNQQGLAAVMANDYETALTKFREAAKFDYAPAIANLGLLYLNGTAVPQDGKQAIALFKRAASLGNVTAAENAGRAYDYGIGVYRSRYHAIEWYERAVNMGSQHAQAAVARLKAEP
jgi:TPR repeat protein